MTVIKWDEVRALAVRGLERILNQDQFSNEVVADLVETPGLKRIDKKFLTALIYGTLEYLLLIDEMIKENSNIPFSKIDTMVLMILRTGVWQIYFSEQIPDASAVDESVKLCRCFHKQHASGYVNAVLRNIAKKPIHLKKKQEHLKYGISSELFGLFKKWYGEETAISILQNFLIREDGLSVLLLKKTEKEQWLSDCAAAQIAVEPSQLLENTFVLQKLSSAIADVPGYREGWFYIQDESSTLVGKTAHAGNIRTVLDACAGLGGKSFALSSENQDLRITCLEPNQKRYAGLLENSSRLGLNQIEAYPLSLQEFQSNEKFDLVLLDVPCSGLGVLRHKPEIKLKATYQKVMEYPKIQLELLTEGANYVQSGGILTYSTCTLNPEENQQLIETFLNSPAGRNFETMGMDFIVDYIKPDFREIARAGLSEWGLLLRPDQLPIDGFFISCMREKAYEQ